jgi:hypothetical protein
MPSTPAPGPAADTRPADTPRARRIRLVGIVALAGLTVVVGWLSLRSTPSGREPASAFEYIRDHALEGDGGAAWRTLLPEGRAKYLTFLKAMLTSEEESAQNWRRTTGLSRKDIQTMSPEDILSREYLSVTESMLRGARVYRTDVVDENTALIYILARDGQERSWMVKRVDGVWKVSDPLPQISDKGWYTPVPGGRPIKIPQPPPAGGK